MFDPVEMHGYLNFLLKTRIDKVSGKRVDHQTRYLMIPALYAISLNQIGKVYDKELGIELVPKIDAEIDMMDLQEAMKYSRKLLIVQDLSFELVEGLPKDITGSSDFMFMHMTEEAVVRHNSVPHPAIAALTAFFRMKQLESVLSFRVHYGLISEHENALKNLIYLNKS
jgi:hypothetical protein